MPRRRFTQGDPLATYIHDHLAGASGALDLLKALRDEHAGEPLRAFVVSLSAEIAEDRATLQHVASRLGGRHNKVKEAIAWLGAKFSRIKLGRSLGGDFGVFQALETLALGIQGKLALWKALAAVSDGRLDGVDFERLCARAESQHAGVEQRRIAAARLALNRADGRPSRG